MKKVTVLLLAAAMLLSMGACRGQAGAKQPAVETTIPVTTAPVTTAPAAEIGDEAYFAQFSPVLRFVVASDVHVHDTGTEAQEQRLADLFETAYAYAESQAYAAVDGVFFAGDIADKGTQLSMDKFFSIVNANLREGTVTRSILGNHEFYTDKENTVSRFLKASGYDSPNHHMVLGGYHFIFISPDEGVGEHFSESVQRWLADQLAAASAEDPSGVKPIFVFQHHHVKDTVYGSADWGVSELTPILEKYPQVVDFSGHSHYPISDPRSVWQGSFTALGTGTLSYYEMDLAGVERSMVFHTDYEGGWRGKRAIFDAAQYYIVEVDANHAIRVQGYDLNTNSLMDDPILIRSVGDPEKFTYTDARGESSERPYFPADTAVELKAITADSATVSFTQAECGDYVQHYRVELYKGEELVSTQYRLSCRFYLPTPKVLTASFSGLESGSGYTVKLIAVSSWMKESEAYSFSFETQAGAPQTDEAS